jgi:uncharacterized repeat protein (TIGR01451 family)
MKLRLRFGPRAFKLAGAVLALTLIAVWHSSDNPAFSTGGTNVVKVDGNLVTAFPVIESDAGLYGINQEFEVGIDVTTAAESYRGFQWKLAWDNAVLNYVSQTPMPPTGWSTGPATVGSGSGPGTEAAWSGGLHPSTAASSERLMWKVRLKCVSVGSTSLHLESLAEDPNFGTATAKKPNTPHTMGFQDASVECNHLADLRVIKSGPSSVNAVNQITYTMNVSNLGPEQATGVTLVDTLPAGVIFVSASAGCNYSAPAHEVTCDLGTINSLGSKQATVNVSVPAVLAGKVLVNQADVSSNEGDLVQSNNHSEASTTVGASNLSITKTAPTQVPVGGSGQYQLGVSSTGSSAAGEVVVTDVLPVGVSYVGYSSTQGSCSYSPSTRTVTCPLGDIAASASATVTINVTFPGTDTTVCNLGLVDWTATPPGHQESLWRCTIVGDNPDADGDGCSNQEELGSNQLLGGQREPANPWDFFDVPAGNPPEKNKVIDLDDAFGVLAKFGAVIGDPIPGAPPYDEAFDRTAPPPERPWATQAPEGGIDLDEFFWSLGSFGHSCYAPP